MASLATIGDLLDGSGWTHALTQANIATPGTAESFLKTAHVTRTRHAHHVTASALSILLHTAYDAYSCEESEPKSFDEWRWWGSRFVAKPQSSYALDGGGTKLARIIEEFEVNCLDGGTGKASTTNLKHHEHTASAQVKFSKEVGALIQVFEEMGNPFMEESEDLLVLDSREIADPAIVQSVRSIEKTGQDQYDKYMTERVIERTTSVFDPISKNQMLLFSRPPSRLPSKKKLEVTVHYSQDYTLHVKLAMATWTISSNMKIMHTPRHCPCLESFGLGQNLTLSSVWKNTAHHVERLHWLTSLYWMVLQSLIC
ncbi:hypothetical protein PoB_007387400 [Plakobranchus ocellatus]|uniref:Uncharacterized protein n=1 Tax=Plakobranchus ocellatus TaxID=259542 RepID=A0AAV4DTQ1_9GAST|nr:hypothetical protein PoB_007387400 [Plakobranchus ocellatus]